MFEPRPDLVHIQTRREWIVAIIESINSPFVAATGRSLEAAKAWIVGARAPSGKFSIYVYLHFPGSNESLVYLHEPAEIAVEQYHETELEALQFVESMGFMVDNANFRNLSLEQQEQMLRTLPCFQPDLKAWARAQQAAEGGAGDPDLSGLEGDVLELEEVAEELPAPRVSAPVAAGPVISPEGVAKIARLLSSF